MTDTKLTLQEKISLLSWSQVQNHFSTSKFIFWHDYALVMYQSWLSGRNLVVYGKGGFGKSEMTYYFLELLTLVIPEFSSDLLDCGGADSTKIWAGIKGSELPNFIYNVEKSWLGYKYIVFEELFDAQLSALVEMKQTLTSGEFRTPLQRFVSKCEWLICLTNKSKAEVLDSVSEESRNTVDALLQRFPLAYQLQWTPEQLRNPESWLLLVNKKNLDLSEDVKALYAMAVAKCHQQYKAKHDYMSPRSAMHLLATTQAWAASTGKRTTLSHFLETEWAYPEPACIYFRDSERTWFEPEPEPEPEPLPTLQDLTDVRVELDRLSSSPSSVIGLDPDYVVQLDNQVRLLYFAYPAEDWLEEWYEIKEVHSLYNPPVEVA